MDHKEVAKRLRTNEALEEDLTLANEKIDELQKHIEDWLLNYASPKEAQMLLTQKDNRIQTLEHIIKESIRLLEKSERPFYMGIQMLKEL